MPGTTGLPRSVAASVGSLQAFFINKLVFYSLESGLLIEFMSAPAPRVAAHPQIRMVIMPCPSFTFPDEHPPYTSVPVLLHGHKAPNFSKSRNSQTPRYENVRPSRNGSIEAGDEDLVLGTIEQFAKVIAEFSGVTLQSHVCGHLQQDQGVARVSPPGSQRINASR